jgi:hypothetical protein
MEILYDYGTEAIFSEVAFQAACASKLNMQHVHFDTTSVNVWGDYTMCGKDKKKINYKSYTVTLKIIARI